MFDNFFNNNSKLSFDDAYGVCGSKRLEFSSIYLSDEPKISGVEI